MTAAAGEFLVDEPWQVCAIRGHDVLNHSPIGFAHFQVEEIGARIAAGGDDQILRLQFHASDARAGLLGEFAGDAEVSIAEGNISRMPRRRADVRAPGA